MVTFVYQIILFLMIIGTYGLMRGNFMDINWNFLLSMYGMFVGFLVMFYFSIYKSPEFSKRRKKIIAILSWVMTVIIIAALIHLMIILIIR
ncbi:hypothetical protein [Staphylococcus caprae]|uniref:hypothetical protein n=1 Tax=Staphylococcus caprae TaxID=29380 RepID=UPI001C82E8DB|nr:hypothetical protein [Staphylococcus caprae]MBX5320303.1 hypothetical protein [Staphylococcus caprae]MDI9232165.1 hypothetical protein [Staphylococcus caprae]